MKRLTGHRWSRAICGPLPTSLWALSAIGCVLAVATDPATRPNQVYRAVFVAGLGLACTTMALAGHRRTEQHNTELMADAEEANALLASRLISELDARLVAAGLSLGALRDTYLPPAQAAPQDASHHMPAHYEDVVYGTLRPVEDGNDSGAENVVHLPRRVS